MTTDGPRPSLPTPKPGQSTVSAGGGLQTALWKKSSFLRVLCSPPRPRDRQPALDRALRPANEAGPRRAHALFTSDPAIPPALDRLRNSVGRLQAALWENIVLSKGRLQPPGGVVDLPPRPPKVPKILTPSRKVQRQTKIRQVRKRDDRDDADDPRSSEGAKSKAIT